MSLTCQNGSTVTQTATESTHFSYLEIKSHIESIGVVIHASRRSADSKLPGNYGTAALENWNLKERKFEALCEKCETEYIEM